MCAYNPVMEELLFIRSNCFLSANFLGGRADRPKNIAGTNKMS